MHKSDPRSPGATWLNPYLMSPNLEKTIHFYKTAFGFSVSECAKDEKGVVSHAELHYHDAFIMVGLEGQNGMPMCSPNTSGIPSPVCLCVYVDDVDAFFKLDSVVFRHV